MRFIEAIQSGANFLAFISLAVSLSPGLHWLRFAAPVAVLAAIAQAVVEGPRWQMIPAYSLTGDH